MSARQVLGCPCSPRRLAREGQAWAAGRFRALDVLLIPHDSGCTPAFGARVQTPSPRYSPCFCSDRYSRKPSATARLPGPPGCPLTARSHQLTSRTHIHISIRQAQRPITYVP